MALSTSWDLPDSYWGSDWERLDRLFLGEHEGFGSLAPNVAVQILAERFVDPTLPPDARRVLVARALGEYVEALDTYALLLLSLSERSERSILQTFLDHRTGDVVAKLNDLTACTSATQLAEVVHLAEDRWDEEWRGNMTVGLSLAEKLRPRTAEERAIRRFFAKSKHGFVAVRSPTIFSPVYGPLDAPPPPGDMIVFVLSHGIPDQAFGDSYVDVGGLSLEVATMNSFRDRTDGVAHAGAMLRPCGEATYRLQEPVAGRMAGRSILSLCSLVRSLASRRR